MENHHVEWENHHFSMDMLWICNMYGYFIDILWIYYGYFMNIVVEKLEFNPNLMNISTIFPHDYGKKVNRRE